MGESEIEEAVEETMSVIRDSACFDTKYPQSVTREYLKQLRSAIDFELETLYEIETL
jgi:hypothetical protein